MQRLAADRYLSVSTDAAPSRPQSHRSALRSRGSGYSTTCLGPLWRPSRTLSKLYQIEGAAHKSPSSNEIQHYVTKMTRHEAEIVNQAPIVDMPTRNEPTRTRNGDCTPGFSIPTMSNSIFECQGSCVVPEDPEHSDRMLADTGKYVGTIASNAVPGLTRIHEMVAPWSRALELARDELAVGSQIHPILQS